MPECSFFKKTRILILERFPPIQFSPGDFDKDHDWESYYGPVFFFVPRRVQICTRMDRPTGARVQKMRAWVQKVRAWVQKVSGEDSWVQKIIRSDAPLRG